MMTALRAGRAGLSALCGAGALSLAHDPAAAASKVYSPVVEQGEAEVEYRGAVTLGDEVSQRHLLGGGYGVNAWWFVELYGEWLDTPGDDFKFTAFKIENRIDFGAPFLGVNSGLLLEYKHRVGGGDDEVEVGLLLAKVGKTVSGRLNLLFESALDGPVEFGYAAQSKWKLDETLALGLEAHGTFGELGNTPSWPAQTHQAGPILATAVPIGGGDEVELQLGCLFGLTERSPDVELRLTLEIEL